MSKEKIKKDNNSGEAPPCTPEFTTDEELIKEYSIIFPECSSAIEILSINDNNNIIEFRCLKENKKYTISIKEYLEQIKKNNNKNINELEDICKKHNKDKYICYCFDCNCHLCNECLKTRNHITHRESNIVEIKPIEKELNIVEEIIEDYKMRLEKLRNDKIEKEKENEILLNKEKEIEIKKLRKEYENKIKLRKMKLDEENNKIYTKYKLINEKENIKYKIKIEEIIKNYTIKINNYHFKEKIDDFDNILKMNKINALFYIITYSF